MAEQTFINQLNNLSQSLCEGDINSSFSVDFSYGEGVESCLQLAKKYAPSGKVAILYFKNQYELYSEKFSNQLKANGNKPLHVVMPKTFSDSIESFSHLFNLPEDTRFIICTDNRLINATKYFASTRKIHCAFVVNSLDMIGALSPNLSIKTGEVIEEISVKCNIHLVLDSKNIYKNRQAIADAYAFICANSLALIDYRINAFLTEKKIDKNIYQLVSSAVIKAYPIFSFSKQTQPLAILESLLKIELANACVGGQIYKNFSAFWVAKNLTEKELGTNTLACSIYTAKVYSLYFSGKFSEVLLSPNFNQRAEYLSNALNVSEGYVLDQITKQDKFFNRKEPRIKNLVTKLNKDLNSFIACYDFMKGAVNALGSTCIVNTEEIAPLIKHSGDLILNGMTLCRDGGITEMI